MSENDVSQATDRIDNYMLAGFVNAKLNCRCDFKLPRDQHTILLLGE